MTSCTVSRRPARLVFAFVMMACLLACSGQDSCSVNTSSPNRMEVPEGDGRPVMIDGIFRDDEWVDASKLEINDSITLLVKRNMGNVFLGIKAPTLLVPVIDLFISPDSVNVSQFHISAQLGERRLHTDSLDAEDPPFRWGSVDRWISNQMRWDENELQRIMAAEGLTRMQVFPRVAAEFEGAEMQFLSEKFASSQWFVRMEIKSAPDYSTPMVFPLNTEAKKITGWWKLVF